MSNHKIFAAPYYDVVFKAIFGQDEEKRPLMSLLSSIMDLPIESFDDLTLLNSELNNDFLEQKKSRLDLRIKLKDLTEIDVEVQVFEHLAYKERVLYYWSKMYGGSLVKGKSYQNLKKCVIINIIYFELFDTPKMHNKFQILEIQNKIKFSDHLEIHVLELSKLNAYNRTIENDLLIDWAEFLKIGNEDELMKYKERTDLPDDVLKAIEEYERIKDNPDLQWEALNKQIWIMDYFQGIEDAESRGIEKGIEKGREEGRKEGREEERELTIIETAKKMKQEGIEQSVISRVTGIPINKIASL